MKAEIQLVLLLTLIASVAFAQPIPPPPGVPFDGGIGFFIGAVLLWAGKKKFFDKK